MVYPSVLNSQPVKIHDDIEGLLRRFLAQVPVVSEPIISWDQKAQIYQVRFSINRGSGDVSHFLQYSPSQSSLIAWTGSCGNVFPIEVRNLITACFPNSLYRHRAGVELDGFHQWFQLNIIE